MKLKRRLLWIGGTLITFLLLGAFIFLVASHVGTASFADALTFRRDKQAAVLLTGDAGFLGADPSIARSIEALGLPVHAVSSLAAFRRQRSIAETVAIVEGAVRDAKRDFHADKILLIGHSFGADAVGTAVPDLAPDVRRSLLGVVLIVPTDNVYLRADPSGLSYRGPRHGDISRIQSVDWTPLLCIYGKEETDSLCPTLRRPNVLVIALPGGHPLQHDRKRLALALKQGTSAMLDGRRR